MSNALRELAFVIRELSSIPEAGGANCLLVVAFSSSFVIWAPLSGLAVWN